MDDGLSRFREAADRENAERPVRRRYSPTLQREAVALLAASTWAGRHAGGGGGAGRVHDD